MSQEMTTEAMMYEAMQRRDYAEFKRLWQAHPEYRRYDDGLDMWFNFAARGGHLPLVEWLVSNGTDVNEPSANDSVPSPEGVIDGAASEGHLEVVRWLLDHGAKVNFEVEGQTRCFALTGAVFSGHLEVVKLLVERGADVNAFWAEMTPLSYALMYNQDEIAAYLRSVGAKEPHELVQPDLSQSRASIVKHFEKHRNQTALALALQEVVPGDPPITINVIPPSPGWGGQTLFTVGMSHRPLNLIGGGQGFTELAIYLPADWPLTKDALADPRWSWPITWLRRIARYPHQTGSWPSGPSVVFANEEPPQPLAPNTKLTCLMCLADFGDFGQITLPDHRLVQVYSIYPLYTEERDLEKREGTMALIERFQKHHVSRTVDVNRPNVALLPGG